MELFSYTYSYSIEFFTSLHKHQADLILFFLQYVPDIL